MKNTKTSQIATHIGWNISAVGKPLTPTMHSPELTLLSAGAVELDCGVVPAASIVVQGENSILQLRDFCDEILGEKDCPIPPVQPPHGLNECRELIFMVQSYYLSQGSATLQENLFKRIGLVPEATFNKLTEFLKQI